MSRADATAPSGRCRTGCDRLGIGSSCQFLFHPPDPRIRRLPVERPRIDEQNSIQEADKIG
jgi:hypothetical protein